VYQNAAGLDVSVHNAAAVQVTHRPHHLLHYAAYGVCADVRPLLRPQPYVEPHASVLKYDVHYVGFRLENIDYLHDVRVIKPPQHGDFAKDAQGIS
jgi:hypothetical protein